MNNRPFPLDRLQFDDASLIGDTGKGEVKGFRVRVTNNSDAAVKDIRIRVDIFDQNRRRIDGKTFSMYDEVVPPRSTRLIDDPYVYFHDLPPTQEWTWTFTVEGARKVWVSE